MLLSVCAHASSSPAVGRLQATRAAVSSPSRLWVSRATSSSRGVACRSHRCPYSSSTVVASVAECSSRLLPCNSASKPRATLSHSTALARRSGQSLQAAIHARAKLYAKRRRPSNNSLTHPQAVAQACEHVGVRGVGSSASGQERWAAVLCAGRRNARGLAVACTHSGWTQASSPMHTAHQTAPSSVLHGERGSLVGPLAGVRASNEEGMRSTYRNHRGLWLVVSVHVHCAHHCGGVRGALRCVRCSSCRFVRASLQSHSSTSAYLARNAEWGRRRRAQPAPARGRTRFVASDAIQRLAAKACQGQPA
jgi:hypothetical protein